MAAGRAAPMIPRMVTVVVAEPHPLSRAVLSALLAEDGSLDVVPVADLPAAVDELAHHGAPVLVVARRLLERGPSGVRLPAHLPEGVRVIVVGVEDGPWFALDARRAGAAAYVVKDRADRELRAQVRALTTPWPVSA
jgi:DNA-binding NarL/FixJ family response regulator